MAATTVRSYCKINLGLRIGPPRADGYHALRTLYQTIGLHDVLTVAAERAAATEIVLTCSDVRVPTDHRNTVHRMLTAALEAMGVTARVVVHLKKNLPMQGGLGAGSANAVSALLGLERQLGVALGGGARLALAERVGSDVPLFLLGGTVYGHNRGEAVMPYPDVPATPCVVVFPGVGSSTPLAFRAWDAAIGLLTPAEAEGRLTELGRVYASAFSPAGSTSEIGASGVSGVRDLKWSTAGNLAGNPLPALVRTGIENDFEEVVFQQHPFLRDIKRALAGGDIHGDTGALVASLSGSGSSLFALYRSDADAEAARVRASAQGVTAVVTSTLTRDEYWRGMFA